MFDAAFKVAGKANPNDRTVLASFSKILSIHRATVLQMCAVILFYDLFD